MPVMLVGLACMLAGCAGVVARTGVGQPAIERGLLPAILLSDRPLPEWTVDARRARYRVPGVSIALIDHGRIVWTQGYGTTRAGGGEAVSPATRFQAASIAKLVTATGAMRLVRMQRLALDEDVDARLRRWKIPANAYTARAPVTLRLLLSHRAGTTVAGFPGYPDGAALPDLRQVLDGTPPANTPPIRVDAVPGSVQRYSGGGYVVVQQLIEEATGRSLGDVLQHEVLDRAGMRRSTFRMVLPQDGMHGMACGHGYDGTPVEHCGHRYPETAAAWLWSTPADLARLGIALSDALRGRSDALLDPPTARTMLTADAGGMGLGPGVHGDGAGLYFDHAGWNRGFRAYVLVYPHAGQGIAVMANGDGGDELIQEIVRSAAKARGWPGFAPASRTPAHVGEAELDAHAGDYEVAEDGLVLTVVRDEDHLVVRTPRGSSYTFHPAGAGAYFAIEDGSELQFDVARDGSARMRVWGMAALRRRDD